jgi:hypothetical protein
MAIMIMQLIHKYQRLQRDLIENEKFHEAKIVKDVLADLIKLHDLQEKQNGC